MAKNSDKKKKKESDFYDPVPDARRISEIDDDDRLLRMLDAAQDSSFAYKIQRFLRPRLGASNVGLQLEQSQNDVFEEHGSVVIDTLLSLHRLKESVRADRPLDNEEPNLDILVQSAVGLSEDAMGADQTKNSGPTSAVEHESLNNLREYIWDLHGVLAEGWEVETQKRSGKVDKFYISPDKRRFRSRVEVARFLGVAGNSKHSKKKKKKQPKPAPVSGSGIGMDLFAEGRSDTKTSPVLADDHVDNAMRDATNSVSRTVEDCHSQGSQFHAQDPRIHIEREESGSQNQNNERLVPAQAYDQISETPKFGEMKRHDTVEEMQEAVKWQMPRQEVPSAALLTQRCQDILRDVISAEKFGALKMVLNRWSPLGFIDATLQFNAPMLMAGTLDLQLLSLRLASGVYGRTPEMFSTDIQQVWKNISSVGNELISLAKALSELSYDLYKQQVVNLFPVEYEGDGPGSSDPLDELHQQEQEPLLCKNGHFKQSVNCNEAFLGDSQGQTELPHQVLETEFQKLNSSYCDKATGRQTSGQPEKMCESVSLQNLTANNSESACKRCGLKQGSNCSCQVQSNAGCPTYCIFPISSCPESGYCSAACTVKSAMGQIHTVSIAKGMRGANNGAKELSLMPKQNADEACKPGREAPKITWTRDVCKELAKHDGNIPVSDTRDTTDHVEIIEGAAVGNQHSQHCPVRVEAGKKSAGSHEMEYADGHRCAVCDQLCIKPVIPFKTELSKDHVVSNHANVCKLCGFDAGKTSIISCSGCGKIYHLPCPRPSIKEFPKGIWFFPLCLCRVCQMDVNDKKTLLCEHCNRFYHTRCLGHHLADIPEGSWFCRLCVELQNPAMIVTPLEELVGTGSESKQMTEVWKRKRKSKVPRRSW